MCGGKLRVTIHCHKICKTGHFHGPGEEYVCSSCEGPCGITTSHTAKIENDV